MFKLKEEEMKKKQKMEMEKAQEIAKPEENKEKVPTTEKE